MKDRDIIRPTQKTEQFRDMRLVIVFLLLRPHAALYYGQGCLNKTSLPFCWQNLSIEERLADLAGRLEVSELIGRLKSDGVVPAVARIGLPEFNYRVEAIHGLEAYPLQIDGKVAIPTYFPIAQGAAATFNRTVFENMGRVISSEARIWSRHGGLAKSKRPVGVSLRSPMVNVLRDPRWGRSDESPSEDPFLTSVFGNLVVKGLQDGRRCVSEVKHFAAYDIETNRNYEKDGREGFDAVVSDFDWEDTYVVPFRAALRDAHAMAYMCSYNAVNGRPSCANDALVSLARDEWGMRGFVESDCDAVGDLKNAYNLTSTDAGASRLAIENGTDLDCGSTFDGIQEALNDGTLRRETVENAFKNAMRPLFDIGLFDQQSEPEGVIEDASERAEMARDAARQSLVLLKNDNGLLPLDGNSKIALIGPLGFVREELVGPITIGPCVSQPKRMPQNGYKEDYGCVETMNETLRPAFWSPGSENITSLNTSMISEAVSAALKADVVIFALGAGLETVDESEDLRNVSLPGIQNELVEAVRKAVDVPLVVVLVMGNQFAVDSWIEDVDAVIDAFIPSHSTKPAQVIVDAIFGENCGKFGKLPYTLYPASYVDTLELTNMSFIGRGYRYSSSWTFPFGFGLNYVSFSLSVAEYTYSLSSIKFSVSVENCGDIAADEVVQIYFRPLLLLAAGDDASPPPPPRLRPRKKLIDFARIRVGPRSRSPLVFDIDPQSSLSLVDERGRRAFFPGSYELLVTNGGEDEEVSTVVLLAHFTLYSS